MLHDSLLPPEVPERKSCLAMMRTSSPFGSERNNRMISNANLLLRFFSSMVALVMVCTHLFIKSLDRLLQ
jgi:hypothetical protein